MNVKLFEIRDKGTFMPVLAIQLTSRNDNETYLMSRSGYGTTPRAQERYILLMRMAGGSGRYSCDPYDHGGGSRTMTVAHDYIMKNWTTLESGTVVCVEHILGERPEPKTSERFD